jgi:hypothetical protein
MKKIEATAAADPAAYAFSVECWLPVDAAAVAPSFTPGPHADSNAARPGRCFHRPGASATAWPSGLVVSVLPSRQMEGMPRTGGRGPSPPSHAGQTIAAVMACEPGKPAALSIVSPTEPAQG